MERSRDTAQGQIQLPGPGRRMQARVHGLGQDCNQHAKCEANAVTDRRRCSAGRRQPEEKVQIGDRTGVLLVREQGSCTGGCLGVYSTAQMDVIEGCLSVVSFHTPFDHVYLDG